MTKVTTMLAALALSGLVVACDKDKGTDTVADGGADMATSNTDGSTNTDGDGSVANGDGAVTNGDGSVANGDGSTTTGDASGPSPDAGPPSYTYEEFTAAFAEVFCDHLECIGSDPNAGPLVPLFSPDGMTATCRTRVASILGPVIAQDAAYGLATDAVVFDGIQAHACIEALSATSECNYFNNGGMCAGFAIFRGVLSEGAACRSEDKVDPCAAGLGCVGATNGCPGTCTTLLNPGDECSSAEQCDSRDANRAECQRMGDDTVPHCYLLVDGPEGAEGDMCNWNLSEDAEWTIISTSCGDGLSCDMGTCQPRSGGGDETPPFTIITEVGADCGFSSEGIDFCDPYLHLSCDNTGKCVAIGDGSLGAVCNKSILIPNGDNCGDGLYCTSTGGNDGPFASTGECATLKMNGDVCDENQHDQCASGYCAHTSAAFHCMDPVCSE